MKKKDKNFLKVVVIGTLGIKLETFKLNCNIFFSTKKYNIIFYLN